MLIANADSDAYQVSGKRNAREGEENPTQFG
jgi:hypothetical protein